MSSLGTGEGEGEPDWRAGLDAVDAALIDGYQSGFPVAEEPFQSVAADLGVPEAETLERVRALYDRGIFRRFGAGIIAEIEAETGCEVLVLPMLTDFYIDLEFPVVNEDRFARESLQETAVDATRISEEATADLTDVERRLLLEIQDGFPLTRTPYRDIAAAIDAPVDSVLAAVERLLGEGCIKRVGCVVNHIVTGFDANCMVVWDVPDDELDARGEAVGSLPYVTLCYHRPRRPDQDWGYNLFTMVHGREAAAVDAKVDELAADHLPFEHERLYSTETLKQTGARYDDIVSGD